MAMTMHMSYDGYSNPDCLRSLHYKGPFHLARRHGGGEPDARQGLGTRWRGARLPSIAPPKFDIAAMGGLVIPAPRNKVGIPGAVIRDADSTGRLLTGLPDLIPFWPTSKPIFIPADQVPPGLAEG
jgi:hypothetical protein